MTNPTNGSESPDVLEAVARLRTAIAYMREHHSVPDDLLDGVLYLCQLACHTAARTADASTIYAECADAILQHYHNSHLDELLPDDFDD